MRQFTKVLGTFMAVFVMTVFPSVAHEEGEGLAATSEQSGALAGAVAALLNDANENNNAYSYYSAGQLASGMEHSKFKVGDESADALSAVDMLNRAIEIAGADSELGASAQALVDEAQASESVEEWYCYYEWWWDSWWGEWVIVEICY